MKTSEFANAAFCSFPQIKQPVFFVSLDKDSGSSEHIGSKTRMPLIKLLIYQELLQTPEGRDLKFTVGPARQQLSV